MVGGGLVSLGVLLLVAAALAYVPLVRALPAPGIGDTHLVSIVSVGLVGVILGSVLLPEPSPPHARDARFTLGAAVGAAAVVPILTVAGILLTDWRAIASPTESTPELHRLLLVASMVALLVVPAGIAFFNARAGAGASALPPRSARRERIALGLLVAAFGLVVGLVIASLGPLGWDESVYAVKSGELLHGWPDTGWGAHRPPLLSVLGLGPLLLGTDEALLRSINLLFAIVGIIATWYLARAMAGPRAAVLAALLVAGMSTLQYQAGLFLSDVPSAALVIVLMVLVWHTMEADAPIGWGILWFAPLAIGTFYLRYGSILPLGGVVVAALLLWPRRVREAWAKHLVMGAVALILLVPHLFLAVEETGSPFGVISTAQAAAAGASWGSSLVAYAAWLPWRLAGPLPAAAATLGLAGAVRRLVHAAVQRRWSPHVRGPAFLLIVALVQVLGLGSIHAESRYVLLPMMLLCVAGSVIIADGIAQRGAARNAPSSLELRSHCGGRGRDRGVQRARSGHGQCAPAMAAHGWPAHSRTWAGRLRRRRQRHPGDHLVLALPHAPVCAGRRAHRRSRAARHESLSAHQIGWQVAATPEVVARYLARADPEPIAVFRDRSGTLLVSLYRMR